MSSELMDDFETALRDALAEEAAAVTPSVDGLSQIRRRIATGVSHTPVRRAHSPWLGTRGAVVATAAVAVIATVLALVFVGGGEPARHHTVPASQPPSPQPSPQLSQASPAPGTAAVLPAHFYAITKGATVDEYATATGRHVERLTPQQSQVPLSDLQRDGNRLFFIKGGLSPCRNEVDAVDAAAGGAATLIQHSDPGFKISAYATNGGRLALVEQGCSSAQRNELVTIDGGNGRRHVISWQGNPPAIIGDPAWVDGGKQLAVIWRGGTQASVLKVDPSTATGVQGQQLCGGPAYLPEQLAAAGGKLYTVAQQGRAIVVQCSTPPTGPSVVLPRQDQPGDLAAVSAGSKTALLALSPTNGAVRAWLTGHRPRQVPALKGISSIAW